MKEKIIKEILRSKLLINYELSKTYKENIAEQGTGGMVIPSEDRIKREIEQEKENKKKEYPNYCKYPDKTYPWSNACSAIYDEGHILRDPVSTESERKELSNFCQYAMPKPNNFSPNQISSLILPKDTEILFWDWQSIIEFRDQILSKKTYLYKENNISSKTLNDNLRDILPVGTVRSFRIGDSTYETNIIMKGPYVPGESKWFFSGYKNKENEFFNYVICKDERNVRQKITDEWGWVIQWGGVALTAILGLFTEGASWLLTVEILSEMGIGTFIAWREIEKGKNIQAALSLVTGALPLLKVSKSFRGVNPKYWDEISNLLGTKNYNNFSSFDDYVKFYDDLSEEGKKAWNIIVRQDEFLRTKLSNEIVQEFSEKGKEVFFKEAKQFFKNNPSKELKIEFFRRLWVRELGTNFGVVALAILVEVFWGNKLNSAKIEDLNNIFLIIPPTLQLEMILNLMEQTPEVGSKILENVTSNLKNHPGLKKLKSEVDKWNLTNTLIEDGFMKEGVKYKEISEDKSISLDYGGEISNQELQKLKDEGWVLLPLEGEYQYSREDLKFINGELWIKKDRLKTIEKEPEEKKDLNRPDSTVITTEKL